jgi:hypothetical protein
MMRQVNTCDLEDVSLTVVGKMNQKGKKANLQFWLFNTCKARQSVNLCDSNNGVTQTIMSRCLLQACNRSEFETIGQNDQVECVQSGSVVCSTLLNTITIFVAQTTVTQKCASAKERRLAICFDPVQ